MKTKRINKINQRGRATAHTQYVSQHLKTETYKYDKSILEGLIRQITLPYIYYLSIGVLIDLVLSISSLYYYLIISIFPTLITFPAILLAINYYLSDRNVTLEIDYENETLSYQKGEATLICKFEDVRNSVYHLGFFYKNLTDLKLGGSVLVENLLVRRKIIGSNCGYWHLEFKDGTIINVSSFVQDLIFEYPFIKKTRYSFSFVPLIYPNRKIKGSLLSCEYLKTAGMYETRFFKLYNMYSEYSESKLKRIIENPKKYQTIAVKVATQLLNERNNVG